MLERILKHEPKEVLRNRKYCLFNNKDTMNQMNNENNEI